MDLPRRRMIKPLNRNEGIWKKEASGIKLKVTAV
jgi:hypothetical protein